jgi:hypothetical protein
VFDAYPPQMVMCGDGESVKQTMKIISFKTYPTTKSPNKNISDARKHLPCMRDKT